mmetsp:Transcript_20117/g.27592  ORF Transcript_20117/g.27592 Transcript_20117/m.27592 type:complete len:317 (+) Transcript_20117:583-1533(+)
MLSTLPTRSPSTMRRWLGSRKPSSPTPPLRGGRSLFSHTHPPMDLDFAFSRRTTSSTGAAGSTTPTTPSAASSSRLSVRTAVSRHGSQATSISDRTTKTPSLSQPSIPRTAHTPTAVHARSFRRPSCVAAPRVMDVSNLVLSAVTRMDLRSALLTTRRMERSVLTQLSHSATATTRLECTPTMTRLETTIITSRCTSHLLVILFTPLTRVTAVTMKMVKFLLMRRSPWILLLGGIWPVVVLLVCLMEISLSTIVPLLLPLVLLLVLMSLLESVLLLSTLVLRVSAKLTMKKVWRVPTVVVSSDVSRLLSSMMLLVL